jgi:hypothetical protein
VFGANRLEEVRRREPSVLFIHTELSRSIAAALSAYGE